MLCTVTVEVTVNLPLFCALMNTKTADLCTNTLCPQGILSFYLCVCEALTNNCSCIDGLCCIRYVLSKLKSFIDISAVWYCGRRN